MSAPPLFWVGNVLPAITQTIETDGLPVDLSGSTVKFKMRPVGSATLKIDADAAFVTDGKDGQVAYAWADEDVDTAGFYLAWWTVDESQDVAEAVVEFRTHSPAEQPAYVELEVFKVTANLTGQTYADTDIQTSLLTASRAIDEATDRRFYLDPDNTSVRVYSPTSRFILQVDDIVDVQAVKIDRGGTGTFSETWTLGQQYVLDPSNAPQDFKPWETIRVRKTNGYHRAYLPCSDDAVQVTGQFGWAEVPSGIKTATTIIAAKLLKRVREAPFGIVFSTGLDSTAAVRIAKTDPDVAPILVQYTRHRPFA